MGRTPTLHPTDCPRRAERARLDPDLGRYALLYEPFYDQLTALDAAGLAIWQRLDGRRSLEQIAGEIRREWEDAPPGTLDDVLEFVAGLARDRFVQLEAGDTAPQAQPAPGGATHSALSAPTITDGFALPLADGSHITLCAGDDQAAEVLAGCAAAMRLAPFSGRAPGIQVRLATVAKLPTPRPAVAAPAAEQVCWIEPQEPPPWMPVLPWRQPAPWLVRQRHSLSACVGVQAQARGGVLLHSALAAFAGVDGEAGVLLAGHSGVGKSTTCRRLPSPWRALCDDVSLVVRTGEGSYSAHPMPTWSRLVEPGADQSWDVSSAVPLRAIFTLDQAPHTRLYALDKAQALCELLTASRQAMRLNGRGYSTAEAIAIHSQRFDNLRALVQAVPVYGLDLSLEGEFWLEMEKVL